MVRGSELSASAECLRPQHPSLRPGFPDQQCAAAAEPHRKQHRRRWGHRKWRWGHRKQYSGTERLLRGRARHSVSDSDNGRYRPVPLGLPGVQRGEPRQLRHAEHEADGDGRREGPGGAHGQHDGHGGEARQAAGLRGRPHPQRADQARPAAGHRHAESHRPGKPLEGQQHRRRRVHITTCYCCCYYYHHDHYHYLRSSSSSNNDTDPDPNDHRSHHVDSEFFSFFRCYSSAVHNGGESGSTAERVESGAASLRHPAERQAGSPGAGGGSTEDPELQPVQLPERPAAGRGR